MTNKVSVIIPIYNVERYLSKCLDSILVDNQFTGQVICVNDGSTDGSPAILELYAGKYSNIEVLSQPNAGLSEARNNGLRAATGEYVLFIDSDDWLLPNTLPILVNRLHGEDVVYFNGRKFFEESQQLESARAVSECSHMDGQDFFANVASHVRRLLPWVCVVGGIYNRSFLLNNNLWNEPGIYHEDSYFTPQVLLKAHDVSCVDIEMYAYRIRGGSITAIVRPKNIIDALYVNRCLYKIYASYDHVEKAFYNYIMDLYIGIVTDAERNKMNLGQWWIKEDSIIMKHCVYDDRSRKIYKLSRWSFSLAYLYIEDRLPSYMRRMINRFF